MRYLSIVLFALAGFSLAEEAVDLTSFRRIGEALILDKQHHHAFVHYSDGKKGYLALERIIGWNDGKPEWRPVHQVTLPEIAPGQILSYVNCDKDGRFVPGIAAIATHSQGDQLGEVAKAWLADLEAGKIREIAVQGIVCSGEGYGQ